MGFVVVRKDKMQEQRVGSVALELVRKRMVQRGLSVAVQKTQIMILAGRQNIQLMEFNIDKFRVWLVSTAKYLGV